MRNFIIHRSPDPPELFVLYERGQRVADYETAAAAAQATLDLNLLTPNEGGIRLAWMMAVDADSRAPMVALATMLTEPPWRFPYSDALALVAGVLHESERGARNGN